MKIESICVGLPQTVQSNGHEVLTSIFKKPVSGPVFVRRHNIEGDRQSDLEVHGGEFKAVYAYSAENYDYWRAALGRELEPSNFGENLLIRNFDEPTICIGDRFQLGDAELEAVQPRLPCYKLGVRFGDPAMIKKFTAAGRWGIYFRVEREGQFRLGDSLQLVHRDPERIPVYEVARVFVSNRNDVSAIRRLAAHQRLAPGWREWFQEKLNGRE